MTFLERIPRPVLIVLVIIAAIIIILAIVIAIFASMNKKAMNKCIDSALDAIRENHTLTEIVNEDYKTIKLNAFMKFDVDQYRIEDVGNLSVMKVNMGIMQMATFVITPKNKDVPLLSADYMYIMPTRKSYLELYDVVVDNDDTYNEHLEAFKEANAKYDDLEDTPHEEAWFTKLITVCEYKKTGISDDDRTAAMLIDNVKLLLEMSDEYPALAPEKAEAKRKIVQEYSDRLIAEGGVSTTMFKKYLGEEVTKDFFDKVFFGTAL